MHALPVLRNAAESALDDDSDLSEFHSIVDPQSVLELIEIAETRWSDEEKRMLSELLRDLSDFVRRAPASAEREELLKRSKQLCGVLGI